MKKTNNTSFDDLKVELFAQSVGCACFMCTCDHWKMVQLSKKDLTAGVVSRSAFERERYRVLKRHAPDEINEGSLL